MKRPFCFTAKGFLRRLGCRTICDKKSIDSDALPRFVSLFEDSIVDIWNTRYIMRTPCAATCIPAAPVTCFAWMSQPPAACPVFPHTVLYFFNFFTSGFEQFLRKQSYKQLFCSELRLSSCRALHYKLTVSPAEGETLVCSLNTFSVCLMLSPLYSFCIPLFISAFPSLLHIPGFSHLCFTFTGVAGILKSMPLSDSNKLNTEYRYE